MFWLALIWIVAALCGLTAAAVWEPLLSASLAIARTVDPGLANYLAQYAGVVEAGGDAIGWLVALVVGLPLTLLWLVLRVVGGVLRGPDGRRRGERHRDEGERRERLTDRRESPTPRRPDAERVDRPAPRGSTFDVSPRRDGPAAVPREPTPPSPPEPQADRTPPADTPRWGRQ